MGYAFNHLAKHGRAASREQAIDKGIEASRSERAKANDLMRSDHEHFEYKRFRSVVFGGLVVERREWFRSRVFYYPEVIDIHSGDGGFNRSLGSGGEQTLLFSGYSRDSQAVALIMNVSDEAVLKSMTPERWAATFDIPVFVVHGTSDLVHRYQWHTQSSRATCSVYPSGQSC